jgi:hypothetical protein
MSFRTRLILWLLTIVLTTAIAVEYVVFTFSRDRLKMEVMHQLRERVTQTLNFIDRFMLRRAADIRILASDNYQIYLQWRRRAAGPVSDMGAGKRTVQDLGFGPGPASRVRYALCLRP